MTARLSGRRIGTNALVYLGAVGANALIPLVVTPVLTRLITPGDFGLIATYATVSMLMVTAFRFELNTAAKKIYSVEKELLTPIFGVVLWYAALLVPVALAAWFLAARSGLMAPGTGMLILAAGLFVTVARIPTMVLHNYWHLEQKAVPYALWSVLALGGMHVLTVLLVLTAAADWRARLLSETLVAGAALALTLAIMVRAHGARPRLDRALLGRMVRIAAPLWPGAVIMTLLFNVDRLAMIRLATVAELGVYSVALQFAAAINMLFAALNPIFEAWAYGTIRAGGRPGPAFWRVVALLLAGSLAAGLAFGLALERVLPLLVDEAFHGAVAFVLPLALALSVFGMVRWMNVVLICRDRFVTNTAMTVLALASICLAVAIAVPRYGVGAIPYCLIAGYALTLAAQAVLVARS